MRLRVLLAIFTAFALLVPPVRAAIKTFDVALTSNANVYHEGDEIVLTFTAKNIARQTEMLAARTHLQSTIAVVVKRADGSNIRAQGPFPKLSGPDELDAHPAPPGGTFARTAPISLWGYHLGLGSYAIFGTWQMEPTGELVKSTVIHVTVAPVETPAPPTPTPTVPPYGP